VASVDGKEVIRDCVKGPAADPRSLGIELAERLLSRGGDRILRTIYGTAP
jgi:hydroxymethylbilane synthase